jgi:hypothetical protein
MKYNKNYIKSNTKYFYIVISYVYYKITTLTNSSNRYNINDL